MVNHAVMISALSRWYAENDEWWATILYDSLI